MAGSVRLAVYYADTLLRRQSFDLDVVKVGALFSSDLRLDDDEVSSIHALLERGPHGWTVVDVGSRTGTFVNGERIGKGAVALGDRLRFGGMSVHVEALPEAAAGDGTEVEGPKLRAVGRLPLARSTPSGTAKDLAGEPAVLRARSTPSGTAKDFAGEPVSDPNREIRNAERLASLRGRRAIKGDLSIGPGPFETLEALDQLERVGGMLGVLQPRGLRYLELPVLSRVGGDLCIAAAPDLTGVRLPRLGSTGRLVLADCQKLTDVELPALAATAGSVMIGRCPRVERVACLGLGRIGGHFHLTDSRIERLDMPVLERVDGCLMVTTVRGLTRLSLPALVRGERVVLREAFDLRALELPALERVDGSLQVGQCDALGTVDLRSLRHIGDELALLSGAESLEVLELPELETIGRRLLIAKLPGLRRIVAPKLRTVGEKILLGDLPALVELHLPRLERAPKVVGKRLPALPEEVAAGLSEQLARHDPNASRVRFFGHT